MSPALPVNGPKILTGRRGVVRRAFPQAKGAAVQKTRGGLSGARMFAWCAVFLAATAAGVLYLLCLTYAAKLSLFFLMGEWNWSPGHGSDPALSDVLAALWTAGPLALLSSAALPVAVLVSSTRPCLGRFLLGRYPYLGCEEVEAARREALRSGLERRLGSAVVLDPPSHQTARLLGFGAGLALSCVLFGGPT